MKFQFRRPQSKSNEVLVPLCLLALYYGRNKDIALKLGGVLENCFEHIMSNFHTNPTKIEDFGALVAYHVLCRKYEFCANPF